ncbi:STRADA [Branchiostoma lanceolatum]|uniref:STRADA protein n=2 Tax=Branchiostoma lanceolatum TaxID=7740 RepID=A0A8K0E957_BRALA|nr:STRADA [Branchiostoma lanceolatum]
MSVLCSCVSRARVGISPPDTVQASPIQSASTIPLAQAESEHISPSPVLLSPSEVIPASCPWCTMTDYQHEPQYYHIIARIAVSCKGATSVFLAKHRPTDTFVSIRRTNLDHFNLDYDLYTGLQHEIHMTRLFHHGHILPYHCTFVSGNELWVVAPFMSFGSCRDLINSHFTDGLGETTIACILRDVLLALDYIHKMGYVHRSVKGTHILISERGQVCLTGMRHSISMVLNGERVGALHEYHCNSISTLPWFSPELLEQNLIGYDTSTDIYSVGITACELANGIVPFSDMPATQMLLEKLNGTMPRLLDATTLPNVDDDALTSAGGDSGIGGSMATSSMMRSEQLPYQRVFSPQFHEFVFLCLQRDPADRPTASQLLTHSFFKQVRRKSAENLIELLYPIKPLTETSHWPKDADGSIENNIAKIEELDLKDEEEWDF